MTQAQRLVRMRWYVVSTAALLLVIGYAMAPSLTMLLPNLGLMAIVLAINAFIGPKYDRQIATCLNHSVRSTDFLARYDGDEFALLLPETELEIAQQVAQKIRTSISTCPFNGTSQVAILVSQGIAIYPFHGDNPQIILGIADQALYKAKNSAPGTILVAPLTQ